MTPGGVQLALSLAVQSDTCAETEDIVEKHRHQLEGHVRERSHERWL